MNMRLSMNAVARRYQMGKSDVWCLRKVYNTELKKTLSYKEFLGFLWENGANIKKIISHLKRTHSKRKYVLRGGFLSLILSGIVGAITAALASAPEVIATAALATGTELVVHELTGN